MICANNSSRFTQWRRCVQREWLVRAREPYRCMIPLAFYALVSSLFAITFAGDSQQLQQISSQILWIIVLLSTFLSAENFYQQDYEDGSLEQQLLYPLATEWVIVAKLLVHTIFFALPLWLLTPLMGGMLHIASQPLWVMMTLLIPAFISLACFAALVSAITVGVSHANTLLGLIMMPVYLPILIVGNMGTEAAKLNISYQPCLLILFALLLMSLVICPIAAAFLLRITLEEA